MRKKRSNGEKGNGPAGASPARQTGSAILSRRWTKTRSTGQHWHSACRPGAAEQANLLQPQPKGA